MPTQDEWNSIVMNDDFDEPANPKLSPEQMEVERERINGLMAQIIEKGKGFLVGPEL